jgi:hypothetical protein
MLPGLLPDQPVGVGDTWAMKDSTAAALCDYDALAANSMKGKLEALDDTTARVVVSGEVRGAARGGEGTLTCDGWFVFDRKAGRIVELTLNRTEVRKPGPVEAGLDVKSRLTVTRKAAETPPELSDSALEGVPLEKSPQRLLLLFAPPDGKYSLVHDRDWHVFWDDARQAVLKRLDHGEVIAQCNLAAGPNAGKGRHQEPEQFREDIRRALGKRFGRFVQSGEVEGAAAGGYRYRVVVEGQEGQVGVIWCYYLVAGPDGDQLLITFTLGQAQAKAFGDQDLQLIGSLQWSQTEGGSR